MPSSPRFKLLGLLLLVLTMACIEGAVYNVIPVTFPAFKRDFAIGLEEMGRAQLVLFMATLIFSLLAGWLVGLIGLHRAAAGSICGLAVAFLAIGWAPGFALILVAVVLFGVALVALGVAGCALITTYFPERRQSVFSLQGLTNAIGATLFPAVVGYWVQRSSGARGGWRAAYVASGLALAAFAALVYSRRRRWPAEHMRKVDGDSLKHLPEVLATRPIYGLTLVMFLHGVAQVGMVSWVGQLYIGRGHVDAVHAALFLSLNSAGFFAGRSLLTWVTARSRIHELLILGICSGLGTVAYLATIFSPSYAVGLLAFTLAGVFISGNGPSVNSYTGRCYPDRAPTAFALITGLGNLGGAAGAYVVGAVGGHVGLDRGIWFLPAFSAALSALAILWYLRARRTETRMQSARDYINCIE